MVLIDNKHDKVWKWGGPQSPPLQTAIETEKIRNLQDCETYGIQVYMSPVQKIDKRKEI